MRFISRLILLAILCVFIFSACAKPDDVVRPEPVLSKRKAVLEHDEYKELSTLWKTYYDVFPSEDAYANWMYAARYAGDENYESLLKKGLKKYPANPTLLYLSGILHHGAVDDHEALAYLERSASLAPDYDDPWFALVTVYMERQDDEKLNLALRRLLTSGAVDDEIMDYNYNVLATLDSNAILFTNGDNDTYPCWILQQILNYRRDVTVVNRSLLNTDWYPSYMMEHGLPKFMTTEALKDFRERRMAQLKKAGDAMPAGGPYSDSLIIDITNAAKQLGRPVYFALTLYVTEPLKALHKAGTMEGLAERVSPAKVSAEEITETMRHWLKEYRTSGLDAWGLRYTSNSDAGKMIISNYAHAMVGVLDSVKTTDPDLRGQLFEWYLKHLSFVMPVQYREAVERLWCEHQDIPIVREWCRSQGIQ